MAERPWWRRLDGLPPQVEQRRREPLSPAVVWAARASFLLAIVAAVGFGVAGIGWFMAVVLAPLTAFSIWAMPAHQRRQVFGR